MSVSTYGIAPPVRGPRVIGPSLMQVGSATRDAGMSTMAGAAGAEQQRTLANQELEQEGKAGMVRLGSTLGGMAGFAAGGPWGAMLGSSLGSIAGGMFSFFLAVLLVFTMVPHQTAEAAMISQMELHQILSYDPDTGVFTWIDPLRNPQVKAGDRAGCVRQKARPGASGYRVIKIGGKSYAEHRLAWLYMVGEWPEHEIDHINRDTLCNRFDNLRPATRKQNAENRGARAGAMSGFRGVSWSGGRWNAVIMHFGKQKMLGSFDDIELAKAARLKAEAEMFTHSTRV